MDINIMPREAQIAYVFNMPKLFEKSDLFEKLIKYQFEVVPESGFFKKIKTELTSASFGPDSVKKNNTVISFDESKQVLSIKGINFRNVIIIFQDLEKILIEEYDVDFKEIISFIEGTVTIHIKTDKNAKNVIKDYLYDYNKFDEIFNEKTYIPTLRITPYDKNMSGSTWFNMVVEPLISNPKKYFIQYSFRNSDLNKFNENANNIESYVEKIINIIEGGV